MKWTLVVLGCLLAMPPAAPSTPALHLAPQAEARLRHVYQWGCSDCDGPEQLSAIRSLTVTTEGTVVVADRYEPFIRSWSRDGELVAWFGSEGQGPGEIQSVRVIAVEDEKTISIVDTRLLRWTTFNTGGEATATRPLRTHGNSMAFSMARREVLSVGNATTPCTPSLVRAVNVDDGSDRVLAELANVPTREPGNCPQEVYSFAAAPDGGFAVGFGDPDYRVREYGPEGKLRRELDRDIARLDKTEQDLEESRRNRLGSGSDVDPLRFHFYGDSIRYDSEGRLWIRTARGAEGQRVFDVFENGTFLDEVVVPLPVPLKGTAFDVAGEYLVVQSPDESGNPRITLFEISWQ